MTQLWFLFDHRTGVIVQLPVAADANPWPEPADAHGVAAFNKSGERRRAV